MHFSRQFQDDMAHPDSSYGAETTTFLFPDDVNHCLQNGVTTQLSHFDKELKRGVEPNTPQWPTQNHHENQSKFIM